MPLLNWENIIANIIKYYILDIYDNKQEVFTANSLIQEHVKKCTKKVSYQINETKKYI